MKPISDINLFENMLNALKQSKLRITGQRKEILKFIIENRKHLDADVILHELEKQTIKISRATIYRTLDVLLQHQIIDKYDFGDGKACYEISSGDEHHDHLVCIECKKIIEFKSKASEIIVTDICKEHHFTHMNHFMQIYGICSKCRDNK
ncbi:MAG: transcriptional repressor [Candidatus Marinimicrobia bacterium]|nr:transcriptional repressor [Candidatus Neomarinimicrobiota bacterium]